KRRLRVFVQKLQVRVRRRAIDVEVVLLDVFGVVAFASGQAEETFLQDRIGSIPERDREADALGAGAGVGPAVFLPPGGPGTAVGGGGAGGTPTGCRRGCSPPGRCPRRAR